FGHLRRVVHQLAGGARAAPDSESRAAGLGAGAGVAASSSALTAFDDASGEGFGGGHLLVLLDDLLEVCAHLGDRLSRHLHLTVGAASHENVEPGVSRVFFREVVTEVSAATFLSFQR